MADDARKPVLAQIQPSQSEKKDIDDDDELAALRAAALMSKKKTDNAPSPSAHDSAFSNDPVPPDVPGLHPRLPSKNFTRPFAQNVRHPRPFRGRGNQFGAPRNPFPPRPGSANLIVIQTGSPNRNSPSKFGQANGAPSQKFRHEKLSSSNPLLLRPQDKWSGVASDHKAPDSPSKPKVPAKFSRYDASDSDSDDESEEEATKDSSDEGSLIVYHHSDDKDQNQQSDEEVDAKSEQLDAGAQSEPSDDEIGGESPKSQASEKVEEKGKDSSPCRSRTSSVAEHRSSGARSTSSSSSSSSSSSRSSSPQSHSSSSHSLPSSPIPAARRSTSQETKQDSSSESSSETSPSPAKEDSSSESSPEKSLSAANVSRPSPPSRHSSPRPQSPDLITHSPSTVWRKPPSRADSRRSSSRSPVTRSTSPRQRSRSPRRRPISPRRSRTPPPRSWSPRRRTPSLRAYPARRRSRSPGYPAERRRSYTPRRSRSPMYRSPRRSRSPGWNRSPGRRSRSPRRRSLSPRKCTLLSPRKRSLTPRRRSLSPWRSMSPRRNASSPRRSVSPRRRSLSPGRYRGRSPGPRSYSPRSRSPAPYARAPGHRASPDYLYKYSPPYSRGRSPGHRYSRSPVRRRSGSPVYRGVLSPHKYGERSSTAYPADTERQKYKESAGLSSRSRDPEGSRYPDRDIRRPDSWSARDPYGHLHGSEQASAITGYGTNKDYPQSDLHGREGRDRGDIYSEWRKLYPGKDVPSRGFPEPRDLRYDDQRSKDVGAFPSEAGHSRDRYYRDREMRSLDPKDREIKSLIPRGREIKSLLPRDQEIKSLLPRDREIKSLLPRDREIKSLLPRDQEARSLNPRHKEIKSLLDPIDGEISRDRGLRSREPRDRIDPPNRGTGDAGRYQQKGSKASDIRDERDTRDPKYNMKEESRPSSRPRQPDFSGDVEKSRPPVSRGGDRRSGARERFDSRERRTKDDVPKSRDDLQDRDSRAGVGSDKISTNVSSNTERHPRSRSPHDRLPPRRNTSRERANTDHRRRPELSSEKSRGGSKEESRTQRLSAEEKARLEARRKKFSSEVPEKNKKISLKTIVQSSIRPKDSADRAEEDNFKHADTENESSSDSSSSSDVASVSHLDDMDSESDSETRHLKGKSERDRDDIENERRRLRVLAREKEREERRQKYGKRKETVRKASKRSNAEKVRDVQPAQGMQQERPAREQPPERSSIIRGRSPERRSKIKGESPEKKSNIRALNRSRSPNKQSKVSDSRDDRSSSPVIKSLMSIVYPQKPVLQTNDVKSTRESKRLKPTSDKEATLPRDMQVGAINTKTESTEDARTIIQRLKSKPLEEVKMESPPRKSVKKSKEDPKSCKSPTIKITFNHEFEKKKQSKTRSSVHSRLGVHVSDEEKKEKRSKKRKHSDGKKQELATKPRKVTEDHVVNVQPESQKARKIDLRSIIAKKKADVKSDIQVKELSVREPVKTATPKRKKIRLNRHRPGDPASSAQSADADIKEASLNQRIQQIQAKNAEIMRRKQLVEKEKQEFG